MKKNVDLYAKTGILKRFTQIVLISAGSLALACAKEDDAVTSQRSGDRELSRFERLGVCRSLGRIPLHDQRRPAGVRERAADRLRGLGRFRFRRLSLFGLGERDGSALLYEYPFVGRRRYRAEYGVLELRASAGRARSDADDPGTYLRVARRPRERLASVVRHFGSGLRQREYGRRGRAIRATRWFVYIEKVIKNE